MINTEVQKILDAAKTIQESYKGPGTIDLHDWTIDKILALGIGSKDCRNYLPNSRKHIATAWLGSKGVCCYCGSPAEYISPTWGLS